ncbi:M28 family peptidase [Pontibacter sp. BT310]|uniref:M28 family peptidase n=1 Tax=Pontibacter populi TaxID=890055 RepID=A0ABS6XD54_9BACT|nr:MULTISPECIES: M28 family peptidase [Pontibacter]MBJ6119078.1 M28 family peptidase [Pontibacter sp. BT310]MBR0571506.1 M28 family peptidase [Microvirga sp. STS03]MBW3365932.1 M28 family peptidase [Pontibacter populi]
MIYRLILGAFLALPLAGLAQQPLLQSGQLLTDVRILSADSLGGRSSGTEGSLMAQDYIIKRFSEIGLKAFNNNYRQQFKIANRNGSELEGTNLVGYIPGKSGKAIVITAHYDHVGIRNGEVYNGADDNASGVAALLAAATYFKNTTPNHTLIFVAPDAEEKGLQGANTFLNSPPVPLQDILLNVNMDMLGINAKGELYASGTFHNPSFKQLLEKVKPREHARLVLGHDKPEQGHNDWTNQSDHFQFHKRKIPFIYFGVEDHAHYHKPTDEFKQINQQFFPDAAALVIEFIGIADRKLSSKQQSK